MCQTPRNLSAVSKTAAPFPIDVAEAFPQSMRRAEFVPKEFNTLGVKLAKTANVQVIPVAIKTDFWENGKYVRDLGPINRKKPIYMTFGEPFHINGSGKEENKKIIEFISTNLQQWNDVKTKDDITEP